jgi:16S rRNA (guanine(966)-N(2))-methyltransferase RsmD
MRVITGTLRGRTLKAPKGLATRPVPARVREALFAILGDMSGARVLDLFAGTGAIGIEALSRGADSAVFVDSGAEQCRVIRANLDALGVRGEVVRADVFSTIKRFARSGSVFDFVFADPPYERGLSHTALELVCGRGLLSPRGIMALTVRKTEELPPRAGDRMIVLDRRYGDTRLVIYGKDCDQRSPVS